MSRPTDSHSTIAPTNKPPLDQMIELWDGIVKLHHNAVLAATAPHEISRQDKLKWKAQNVATALKHYQVILEDY